jgi:Tol biopolymer transport system component
VFARGDGLYVIDPDGGQAHRIWTCNPETLPQQPPQGCWTGDGIAWSPHGSRIAVGVGSYQGGGVFIVSAGGNSAKRVSVCGSRLCSGGGRDEGPVWSPDGSKIAFWRNGNIYSMRADGTWLRQLTHCHARVQLGSCYKPPHWSPSGSELLLGGPDGLYVITAEGGKVRRVSKKAADAVWIPPSQ